MRNIVEMDQSHQEAFSVLKAIKEKSVKILNDLLDVMEDIVDDPDDILNEIEYCTKADKKKIRIWLEKETLKLKKEPKKIMEELSDKNMSLFREEKIIKKNRDKIPYISAVWFGDAYDGEVKLEALNLLYKDLEATEKAVTEEALIKKACEHFAPNI